MQSANLVQVSRNFGAWYRKGAGCWIYGLNAPATAAALGLRRIGAVT
jgi:hypothetical protein